MERRHDHALATAARVFMITFAVGAALMFARSLPDLIRYAKMERM